MPRDNAKPSTRHQFAEKLRSFVERRRGSEAPEAWLAAAIGQQVDTARDYLHGRVPAEDTFAAIARVCRFSDGEYEEMRALWTAAWEEAHKKSLPEMPAEAVTERSFLPDPYSPFSGIPGGTEECFVDGLLRRALSLAQIPLSSKMAHSDLEGAEFLIGKRLTLLEQRKVDFLVNLVTLSRLRKAQFFKTPIRVSLNGVALRSASAVTLTAVRGMLSGKKPSENAPPFHLLTVAGEVGDVHARQVSETTRLAIARPHRRLNREELARRLKETAGESAPTILFCDEVTALGVLGALESDGQLLYPLTTDLSVLGSQSRRQLPTFLLGIGYRRPHGKDGDKRIDEENAALFDDLLRTYLHLEIDSSAARYQALYNELVEFVAGCLAQNNELYVGDLRRTPTSVLAQRSAWHTTHLARRNARSYARRCLQVGRRSAAGYHNEDPWTPVLRRARQRIALAESAERDSIKSTLISDIALAAGLAETASALTRKQFKTAVVNNAAALAQMLDRDFDVRMPDWPAFLAQHQNDSFEGFLSAVQRQLELASEDVSFFFVDVMRSSDVDRVEMVANYNREMKNADADSCDGRRYANRIALGDAAEAVIARNLGEVVGAMWIRGDRRNRVLELADLYVAPHMRGRGASRLLIRHAIDRAAKLKLGSVDICLDHIPAEPQDEAGNRIKWFENVGFARSKRTPHLSYELFQLTNEVSVAGVNQKYNGKRRAARSRS